MSRKSKKGGTAVKKLVIVVVGIVLFTSTLVVALNPGAPTEPEKNPLFCGSGISLSNTYIQEFLIPTDCSEPVGITVDVDGTVWFAESGARQIGRFDPGTEEFTEYPLPDTKEREQIAPVASVWSMKFDERGDLWFPDVVANAIWKLDPDTGTFEKYNIPSSSEFGTSYPINIEFRNDKLWFSEIYAKNIGVLDPALATPNTFNGISEISARVDLETLGPLAVDDEGEIWFTALTYPAIGRLISFDPEEESFKTYDMPPGIASPVGLVFDREANLWINDHGTSTILKFDPGTNETARYATSLPPRSTSIALYEKCLTQPNGTPQTCAGLPVSLPYWNAVDGEGRIWFNEHQGNSLAVLDPSTSTLIEYFVPTQNPLWGGCEDYEDEPCGIANPLQFAIAPNDGRVWFTEWSENMIGVLDPRLPLPISVEVLNSGNDKEEPETVEQGETLTLDLAVTAHQELTSAVEMRVSGTIIPAGRLFNMMAEFGEREISFTEPSTKTVMLNLTPAEDLVAGDYRITISAVYKEVTYSKLVEIRVVEPGKTRL